MSRVYKHENGTYYHQFRGKRKSLKTTDRETANIAARNIERRAVDPTYAAAHEATLGTALTEFVGQQKQRRKAAGTLKMYDFHVGHFARVLGEHTPLVEVDATAVDRYLSQRDQEGAAVSTQGKEMSTLRGALRLAARQGKYHRSLDAVMPHNFKINYVPGTAALTLLQAHKLVTALAPKRAAVCAFIVATGADWKSVGDAKRADIDLQKGNVLVRGSKNRHRWRTIPILAPFRALVELAAKGMPFEPWGNVRRDLTVACRLASLPRVTPRDLRRSHGSILRAMGVEPHLIGKMLGHADARMVEKVYGQLPPDALSKLMLERTQPKPTRARKSKTTGEKQ